jgi:hypothetical protein
VAKLTRLTHKIAMQLYLVAERCTICSSRSRRPVRILLDTPSYIDQSNSYTCLSFLTKLSDEFNGTALGYGLDDRGFECRQGLRIFLFAALSIPAVGHPPPPNQWVPVALSLGCEADYSPPSSAEVKNAWSYASTPQYTFMEQC